MSENIYVTTLIIVFGTIIAIFAIRYRSLSFQAQARLANDDAYRALAEKAAAAEAENAVLLSAIRDTLNDVHGRVSVIEKVLKEVE